MAVDVGTERPILVRVKPLAVHHVSVNVTNAGEGLAFYTDVLGGRERADRPDFGFGGAWIDLGSTQLKSSGREPSHRASR